jgi:hypothetical protein
LKRLPVAGSEAPNDSPYGESRELNLPIDKGDFPEIINLMRVGMALCTQGMTLAVAGGTTTVW